MQVGEAPTAAKPGWVVLAFALVAGVTQAAAAYTTSRCVFHSSGPLRLDQFRVACFTWPTFVCAVIATALCAHVFKAPVGLRAPRTFFLGAGLAALAMLLAIAGPVLFDQETLSRPASSMGAVAARRQAECR